MDVRFADTDLERLDRDRHYTMGLDRAVVTVFRRRMQYIRAARDERDLRVMKSLHYEKLKGRRRHQRSIRLNRQWRLVLELEQQDAGKTVVIVGIEDYH